MLMYCGSLGSMFCDCCCCCVGAVGGVTSSCVVAGNVKSCVTSSSMSPQKTLSPNGSLMTMFFSGSGIPPQSIGHKRWPLWIIMSNSMRGVLQVSC